MSHGGAGLGRFEWSMSTIGAGDGQLAVVVRNVGVGSGLCRGVDTASQLVLLLLFLRLKQSFIMQVRQGKQSFIMQVCWEKQYCSWNNHSQCRCVGRKCTAPETVIHNACVLGETVLLLKQSFTIQVSGETVIHNTGETGETIIHNTGESGETVLLLKQ